MDAAKILILHTGTTSLLRGERTPSQVWSTAVPLITFFAYCTQQMHDTTLAVATDLEHIIDAIEDGSRGSHTHQGGQAPAIEC